jgi:hypothetical protein
MDEDNEYLGGQSPEQEEAAADTEPNPAGGMPDHEQADEPAAPQSGDSAGETIRELGAGM